MFVSRPFITTSTTNCYAERHILCLPYRALACGFTRQVLVKLNCRFRLPSRDIAILVGLLLGFGRGASSLLPPRLPLAMRLLQVAVPAAVIGNACDMSPGRVPIYLRIPEVAHGVVKTRRPPALIGVCPKCARVQCVVF